MTEDDAVLDYVNAENETAAAVRHDPELGPGFQAVLSRFAERYPPVVTTAFEHDRGTVAVVGCARGSGATAHECPAWRRREAGWPK